MILFLPFAPCFFACGSESGDRIPGLDANGMTSTETTGELGNGDGNDGGTTGNTENGGDTGGGSDSGGDTGNPPGCEPGTRRGSVGASDGLLTAHGTRINLRTRDDYDPTVPHPLIMVYAPAGADATRTEQFTGLTPGALARGYIIAYADHIQPGTLSDIANDAAITAEIASEWCIDEGRVFLMGHSNGGSIASLAMLAADRAPLPRAAAPSAAGVQGPTMQSLGCPDEIRSMMVIHSANDQLFPISQGFGLQVAEYWAQCASCVGDPIDAGPCDAWDSCDGDNRVLYCETSGVHGQWSGLNAEMLDFFDGVPTR